MEKSKATKNKTTLPAGSDHDCAKLEMPNRFMLVVEEIFKIFCREQENMCEDCRENGEKLIVVGIGHATKNGLTGLVSIQDEEAEITKGIGGFLDFKEKLKSIAVATTASIACLCTIAEISSKNNKSQNSFLLVIETAFGCWVSCERGEPNHKGDIGCPLNFKFSLDPAYRIVGLGGDPGASMMH